MWLFHLISMEYYHTIYFMYITVSGNEFVREYTGEAQNLNFF